MEFFEKYTPYFTSMIYILKNGIVTPGFNVPSLSHLTLADGVNEVQDVLDLANNTIQSRLDDAIKHFSHHGYDTLMDRMDDKVALDILESTDLQSVLKHLEGPKSGQVSERL